MRFVERTVTVEDGQTVDCIVAVSMFSRSALAISCDWERK
jgi:hypothetical protein